MSLFTNRRDAGRQLAKKLKAYGNRDDVIVLGLPRGGVPVAAEVARELRAPLDVYTVRKLGAPDQPELAIGAIATGNVRVLNQDVINTLRIDDETIEEITKREQQELERRQENYRGYQKLPDMSNKTVILVDDGLATGATMRAAISALRTDNPDQVIVAVPVAPPESRDTMLSVADEVICVATPQPFYGVGAWYDDFRQTTDAQVREILKEAESWIETSEDTHA